MRANRSTGTLPLYNRGGHTRSRRSGRTGPTSVPLLPVLSHRPCTTTRSGAHRSFSLRKHAWITITRYRHLATARDGYQRDQPGFRRSCTSNKRSNDRSSRQHGVIRGLIWGSENFQHPHDRAAAYGEPSRWASSSWSRWTARTHRPLDRFECCAHNRVQSVFRQSRVPLERTTPTARSTTICRWTLATTPAMTAWQSTGKANTSVCPLITGSLKPPPVQCPSINSA